MRVNIPVTRNESMAESHMSAVPITIATGRYDRTSAIQDGKVPVDGCDVTYLNLEPEELFFRAFRYAEFDVEDLIVMRRD